MICANLCFSSASADQRGQVTNLPIPRFVSMKAPEGNVRRGPSLSHRVDWIFKQKNTPLKIIAEFGHWRQVVDWEGNQLWSSGGIVISDANEDQTNFTFDLNEDHSKSMIVWEDFRNGQNFEIFGQVLDLENGNLLGDAIQFTSVVSDSLNNYTPKVKSVMADE